MNNIIDMQTLLNQRADLQSQIKTSPFNGNIEIKTFNNEKYIYVRKREAGKNKSTYIDKYNDELYGIAISQAQHLRILKKQLRKIEKALAELGYQEGEISSKVHLNIDFARANVKNLIYDQAILEGISTTFPQTETIIENGVINGVRASDVQKILNLKHSWEFIIDVDVISSPTNYYLLSYIAKLVNEGFYENGGMIRSIPVKIGGSTYIPPIPLEIDVKEQIDAIVKSNRDSIDCAIELALYCMKTQIFIDGNKRAAIIFANHFLIKNGGGLLVVPENSVDEFKKYLIQYYEGLSEEKVKAFMKEKCWRKF